MQNLKVTMMRKLNLLRYPKTKRSRYGLKTKINISEVSEFSILRYTHNRKLGNLRNMSLPSNSGSSYNSRFKNTRKWNETKSKRFRYDLEYKTKISEISEFSILIYTQNWKLGNLGKFCFIELFITSFNVVALK